MGVYINPKANVHFSFSYAFIAQFNLSSQAKIETGIVIDNFNFIPGTINTLVGLPIGIRYYFPLGEGKRNPFYAETGCHVDYPTNIGWVYIPSHPFILPIAYFRVGYQINFDDTYYLDFAIGYQYLFSNIQSSNGRFNNDFISVKNPPQILYGLIGFGYKF